VDASECPPTFGYPLIWLWVYCWWWLRHSQSGRKCDNATQAWKDLIEFNINENDVVRIAASGTTPYVIGGLQSCNENNVITGHLLQRSRLPKTARFPIDVVVGPICYWKQNESRNSQKWCSIWFRQPPWFNWVKWREDGRHAIEQQQTGWPRSKMIMEEIRYLWEAAKLLKHTEASESSWLI
jgi:hypothetical protein